MTLSRKLFFYPVLAFIAALSLSTCFSAYRGDTGTLVFSLQNPGNSRLIINPEEIETFEHEIILKGPGGTITRKFTGSGVLSVELVPGSWYVKIRATGSAPEDVPEDYYDIFDETPTMLRAMGMKTVEIKAGQYTPATIDMYGATEVTTWEQLGYSINMLNDNYSQRQVGIIVVKDNLSAAWTVSPYTEQTIIIMAEGDDVTISRGIYDYTGEMNDQAFFDVFGSNLILMGDDGAELILDGEYLDGDIYQPLVLVSNEGLLEMHDGVVLQNNRNITGLMDGGAVYVGYDAEFIMRGGIIRNNTALFGGGVFVWGAFDMKSGVIYGNRAEFEGDGGYGVGGGVYVNYEGSFNKTGGIIYGTRGTNNEDYFNVAESEKGDAVFVEMIDNDGMIERSEKQQNSTAGRGKNLNSENDKNWDICDWNTNW